ncbi:Magnetosome protein MamB [Rhodovastum atsumiense]|uniref:Magnetosome biogenesis CDF transporter MamB n=1 Tax=Rhodovastum atsumiense TaxID=504468 RepID=A0A5M6IIC8_9PROT|nr:magnetosome biogenesis CDF transporter MamB [Rhodovastum atsumiense]KAA5608023.1 magnetosome biogenesis CDF transporter MamB [Rhodovastum atsumiense]CAH2598666.1 Magnetosome protein MamB [Rhodovastum atsumiense]
MTSNQCRACGDRVVWWGMSANATLMVFKGVLGLVSGSAALVADAMHSAADVVADWVTLASVWVSKRQPGENYPYGLGNIQFISSAVVGLILFVGSVAWIYESFGKIVSGTQEAPSLLAVVGALVSIVTNEIMYRYEACAGRKNNSPALIAVAWDNRSDAISSVGVLIGIVVAILGFPIADAVAAIFVALMVAKIGLDLNVSAVRGLMDSSLDPQTLRTVHRLTAATPHVQGIRFIRGRNIGQDIHLEINVYLDAECRVFESDFICSAIRDKVFATVEHVREVRVGVTPAPVRRTTRIAKALPGSVP